MRIIKFVLLLTCLMAGTALAQENPSVDVVLSQDNAQQGDVVDAAIYVRNGVNVGGVDVGIAVDKTCLRITERQPGDYLPTSDEEGAFSAFAELNEHDTRLASALTDRTKYVNGDGIFYSVPLEVTCEQGTASVDVTYAQVSSYVDPSAEIIEVVSYDLEDGTLSATGAQLQIGDGSSSEVTVAPPEQATVAADSTVEATQPAPTQPAEDTQNNALWLGALLLVIVGLVGLVGLFFFTRRSR